jgi:hemerythrin-like domain-containing protein
MIFDKGLNNTVIERNPMNDPLKILMEEHRIIEKVVGALKGMAKGAKAGERPPVEDLERAVDFIRTFADRCHHGKEESLLFPALERYGIPKEGGPIGMMLREHEQGRSFVRGMLEGIKAVKDGDDKGYEAFANNALGYTKLLESHIFKEDNILYPMGKEVLDEVELERLVESFERVEEEEIGRGVHERFHKVAEELYSRYGR